MSAMLDMGGYGVYVWTSYAIFAAVLLWDFAATSLRHRRALRAIGHAGRRRAARAAATDSEAGADA